MKVELKAFGIAKDILGKSKLEIELENGSRVADLKNHIAKAYPDFQSLTHFNIAINEEYALDEDEITSGDEIVVIPPVSGG